MGRRLEVPVEQVVDPDRVGSARRRVIAWTLIGERERFDLDREAWHAGLRGVEAEEYVIDQLGLRAEYDRAVAEVLANLDRGRKAAK